VSNGGRGGQVAIQRKLFCAVLKDLESEIGNCGTRMKAELSNQTWENGLPKRNIHLIRKKKGIGTSPEQIPKLKNQRRTKIGLANLCRRKKIMRNAHASRG
jgi:hypothetical protein